jgi:hypothetical protein
MPFGFHHDIPGPTIPAAWQTLLREQARTLEAILTRVAHTVTTVSSHPDRPPVLEERLHILLAEAERFLMAMAYQNVGFEQETAYVHASNTGAWAASPDTTERLHVIEYVNTLLHANFLAARQYLTHLKQALEHGSL